MNREDLLRPSLQGGEDVRALYSSQAFFLASFFGGPIAAATYGLVNSKRLGRLQNESLTIVALAAGGLLLFLGLHEMGILNELSELLGGRKRRNFEIFMRAIGLMVFGAIYLMHRRYFRAAAFSGTEQLSGWVPGILAAVVGGLASGAFLRMVLA